MSTPRTIAGQAALSGIRPQFRRAFVHTVRSIETEAMAPYVDALKRLTPADLDPSIADDQQVTLWPGVTIRAGDYRAARALATNADLQV